VGDAGAEVLLLEQPEAVGEKFDFELLLARGAASELDVTVVNVGVGESLGKLVAVGEGHDKVSLLEVGQAIYHRAKEGMDVVSDALLALRGLGLAVALVDGKLGVELLGEAEDCWLGWAGAPLAGGKLMSFALEGGELGAEEVFEHRLIHIPIFEKGLTVGGLKLPLHDLELRPGAGVVEAGLLGRGGLTEVGAGDDLDSEVRVRIDL
jgi:hypothetical protein